MALKGYMGFGKKPFQTSGFHFHDLQIPQWRPMNKVPSDAVSILRMGSGRNIVQKRVPEDGDPEVMNWYTWTLPARAGGEASWYEIQAQFARGAPFLWIDFEYEVTVFTAGPALTEFTLPRPTAKSEWAEFPFADYAPEARLNGVVQDVVETGAPAAGEVSIVGSAVVTPSLSAGDELRIYYVPAYFAVITSFPRVLGASTLDSYMQMTEARATP